MKLTRIFTEVRYEQALLFNDARTQSNITKELKKTFPLFNFDEQNKVMIFVNPQNNSNCQIGNNRIIVDIEQPSEASKIKSLGSSVIPFVLEKLEVEKTQRIGVRAFFIKEEVSHGANSSSVITSKFFSNELLDLIGENISNDIEPKVSFKIDINQEYGLIVNLAYLQKIKGMAGINNEVQLEEIEATHPLTDLDVFTVIEKEPKQINGVLIGCTSHIDSYLKKIWNGG